MPDKHRILGVHITERVTNAAEVQKTLTAYGCNIRTRVGLHHVQDNFCSPDGLLLLEFIGSDQQFAELRDHLRKTAGAEVKEMVFDHPQ